MTFLQLKQYVGCRDLRGLYTITDKITQILTKTHAGGILGLCSKICTAEVRSRFLNSRALPTPFLRGFLWRNFSYGRAVAGPTLEFPYEVSSVASYPFTVPTTQAKVGSCPVVGLMLIIGGAIMATIGKARPESAINPPRIKFITLALSCPRKDWRPCPVGLYACFLPEVQKG